MTGKEFSLRINRFQKIITNIIFRTEISLYIFHIIISIILGLAAGFGAILFHYLLERMRYFFEPRNFAQLFHVHDYFIVAIPVFGGLICALITRLFPKVARERGVLSVIKSIILNNGLIPIRQTVFHMIAPIISIGTGAPLGPEGPVAKIGSGIGSFMSQVFKLNRKDMMMYTAAGAGAAISAVFNAPIAGVFFGIEVVLLNDLKNRALSALIISSVVSDILSRAILGNQHVFIIPKYDLEVVQDFPLFILMGVMCGVISIAYFIMKKWYSKLIDDTLKIKNEFLKLIPVTIIFGIILMKYYQLFGIGYSTINDVLKGTFSYNDLVILFILKTVFLILFLRSGAFGGTFAPSLSIGAFLGYIFAVTINVLFNTTFDPITFSLIGMGGVLAGINSIPLTAIMLVFEITNDYKFILPLMLVSIISYLVTVYYNKSNVYISELLHEGIDVSKRGEVDLLGKVKVVELMKRDFDKVNHKMPFKILIKVLMNSNRGDVFVVDDDDKLLGIVTLKDVRQAIVDHDIVDLFIANDLAMPVPTVRVDDPVSLAIQTINVFDMENIPVVKSDSDREVAGVLSHQDIIQAYNTLLEEWETSQFLIDYPRK